MGVLYSEPIKIIITSAFWAPLIPFALIFSIIGIVLEYWKSKYIILKRASAPPMIGE